MLPKFIFFRDSDDFEEKNMNGIPVQSDIIPGVILMGGDSANVIDEINEACFSPQVVTTKNAVTHVLDKNLFDGLRSRFGK